MTAEPDTGDQGSSVPFVIGGLIFLGSLFVIGYALLRGGSLIPGFGLNAASAALILAVAARENRLDPASSIQTRLDAARAFVFFYSIYLVIGGVVVTVLALVATPTIRHGLIIVAVGVVGSIAVYLTGREGESTADRLITLIGVVGLAFFFLSIGVFVYDLVRGVNVFRGIAANGIGAALFILWGAYDMPSDPNSTVETTGDAAGIALLFYGLYLVIAGVGIAATSLVGHGFRTLGFGYVVLGVPIVFVGSLLAPEVDIGGDDELGSSPPVDPSEGPDATSSPRDDQSDGS